MRNARAAVLCVHMLTIVLWSALPACATSEASLTPDMVLALTSVREVALAPDGNSIAYGASRPPAGSESRLLRIGELWSVSASSSTPASLVSSGAEHPRWSPDGSQLAWLARDTVSAVPQVHVRALPDGKLRILTQASGGVAKFEWSPDGGRIAYTADDAKSPERQHAEREGRDTILFGEIDGHRRLHIVDVASGRGWLASKGELSVREFAWSPQGDRLVLAATPSMSADDQMLQTRPYLLPAAGGVPALLAERVGPLAFPCWSADGNWIAWLGSISATDPWHGSVFVMPADRSQPPRNLTLGYTGTATSLLPWPAHSSQFVFVGEERQASVLRSIDARTGDIQLLSDAEVQFTEAPSFSANGQTFAVIGSVVAHPNEVFLGRIDRRQLRRVTHSNPQLAGIAMGRQEIARWRSKDGLDIEGVMIKPVGFRADQRYPVVVHVHGGPESVVSNGWRGSHSDWGQLLAARGYLVIYPNYRGSRGRGTAFVSGNRRDLMGREWEDIESSLDHVIALGNADGARAAIYGVSWGGYAAGWGATFASHRFKAAVAAAGIYNWISEAGSNDTRMHEQIAHWDAPLYEHFFLYLERSPIYQIRKAKTPLLMLHGERDEACPLTQAIEMHTALKWRGVPVQLAIYPREGHSINELPHQRDFLSRGLGWLDRHLRPATAGAASIAARE